ncbi:hypothetical protein QTN47_05365 [Danxiaibacter flavus]|uniref:Uncharacterized protein n=1 Tax=Danxiaibacter flavus TaxID=3049108 RepID=A0ABV3ZCV4_9BACT|nr:hypothetical protein QNM32_05365 [Chitinophagaceae bacterium DXS]
MERVGILIERLQEQYQQHADNYYLIVTAQMLLAELQQKQKVADADKKVAVIMPAAGQSINHLAGSATEQKEPSFVNNISAHTSNNNGAAVAAPPVQVKEAPAVEPVAEKIVAHEHHDTEHVSHIDREKEKERYRWAFDPVAEVPTLAHQDKTVYELNEVMKASEQSLNERLRVEKLEVASLLKEAPIRDLRKAIGINDRYLFLSELFRGDETMYERSIKTINDFKILAEAEYWIQRELKTKIGWNESSEAVRLFDQLVRRRFA